MKWFLRLWSYLANPVFVPSLVSLWYFNYADILDGENARIKMYLIFLLTAVIPILFFLVLKVLKLVQSIHLKSPRERVLPLVIYGLLILIVLRGVLNDGAYVSLYYFFIGVFIASIIAIVLSLSKYKLSLHMMAMGGMLGFAISISMLMGLSLIHLIMAIAVGSGLTATSRLSMKAHVGHELVFGFTVGMVCQIVFIAQWIALLQ
jgi:hypothetical protein